MQRLLKIIWLNVHKSTVTMLKNLKNCTYVVKNVQESSIWINLYDREGKSIRERVREGDRESKR